MTSTQSLELAAQAWCLPSTSGKTMDPELAQAFADILDRELRACACKAALERARQSAPDFSRLTEVYALAALHQVWFTLYYAGSGEWSFSVDSSTPSERWMGRDYGNFDCVVDAALERLRSLRAVD